MNMFSVYLVTVKTQVFSLSNETDESSTKTFFLFILHGPLYTPFTFLSLLPFKLYMTFLGLKYRRRIMSYCGEGGREHSPLETVVVTLTCLNI